MGENNIFCGIGHNLLLVLKVHWWFIWPHFCQFGIKLTQLAILLRRLSTFLFSLGITALKTKIQSTNWDLNP